MSLSTERNSDIVSQDKNPWLKGSNYYFFVKWMWSTFQIDLYMCLYPHITTVSSTWSWKVTILWKCGILKRYIMPMELPMKEWLLLWVLNSTLILSYPYYYQQRSRHITAERIKKNVPAREMFRVVCSHFLWIEILPSREKLVKNQEVLKGNF